jgi:hypothetical protein
VAATPGLQRRGGGAVTLLRPIALVGVRMPSLPHRASALRPGHSGSPGRGPMRDRQWDDALPGSRPSGCVAPNGWHDGTCDRSCRPKLVTRGRRAGHLEVVRQWVTRHLECQVPLHVPLRVLARVARCTGVARSRRRDRRPPRRRAQTCDAAIYVPVFNALHVTDGEGRGNHTGSSAANRPHRRAVPGGSATGRGPAPNARLGRLDRLAGRTRPECKARFTVPH